MGTRLMPVSPLRVFTLSSFFIGRKGGLMIVLMIVPSLICSKKSALFYLSRFTTHLEGI